MAFAIRTAALRFACASLEPFVATCLPPQLINLMEGFVIGRRLDLMAEALKRPFERR